MAPVQMFHYKAHVIPHLVLRSHSTCFLYLQQLQSFYSSKGEVMRIQSWHSLSQALALECGEQHLGSSRVPWHESQVSLGPIPLNPVFSDLSGTLAQSPFPYMSQLPN